MKIQEPGREPFRDAASRSTAGVLGMWLFLVVIVMVFAATMLAYLVVRIGTGDAEGWRPDGSPGLPHELIVSTLLLAASSVSMQKSANAMRARLDDRAVTLAWVTFSLGWAFVAVQCLAWSQLWSALPLQDSLYAWTFYVLTALHALHVLGGLAAMFAVIMRITQGHDHDGGLLGLRKCAMYWHCLGLVWLALYATLWAGSFD